MIFTKNKKLLAGWLVIEGILYGAFLFLDLTGRYRVSSYLKFISIVFCFGGTLYFQKEKKGDIYIPAALGLSVFSDIFLLFTTLYLPGLLSFFAVQVLFLLKLEKWYHFSLLKQLLCRFLTFVLLFLGMAVARVKTDAVLLLSCLYFVFFAFNTVLSITGFLKTSRMNGKVPFYAVEKGIFMTGLILFFLCDINVAIFNMSSYIQIEGSLFSSLFESSRAAMWGCYLPGQMLIGISSMENRIICKNKA